MFDRSNRCPELLGNPRFWLGAAFAAFIIALRLTGADKYISLEALAANQKYLVAWINAHELLAAVIYVLIYITSVAFSLPGAVYLTIAGGFLFGAALGTTFGVVGAMAGATIVFLFARILFGHRALDRIETQYPKLMSGIRENAWSYLLVLRFVPLFPFFLVNLAAAFGGVRISTYLVTTFIGILPGTFVYSLSGAGLGSVLDQGSTISAASVLTPTMLAAFVSLAALALAAVPIRKMFDARRLDEKPQRLVAPRSTIGVF